MAGRGGAVGMQSFVKEIIEEKKTCFFISPHLDDAILSAGGLIAYLSKKTNVKVITIFTEAGIEPYTKFANQYIKYCGFNDAKKLFLERRKEDKQILKKLGIEAIHLGFVDGAWRKKNEKNSWPARLSKIIPEFNHLYPTKSALFSGRISQLDTKIMGMIAKKLKQLISKKRDYLIFAPLAVGRHVDHLIARDFCQRFLPKVAFWQDFPYHLWAGKDEIFIKKSRLREFLFDKYLPEKEKLIMGYKTQIKALFPAGNIPTVPEFYYLNFQ